MTLLESYHQPKFTNTPVIETQNIRPATGGLPFIGEKKLMIKKLKIEGMSCGHCSARVEKILKGLKEVDKAQVSLQNGTAEVALSEQIPTVP
jgi:copper chaperone CopZ